MSTVTVELDPELVALLADLDRPVKDSARELIVLELYRRGRVSSGRGAELLGLTREAFLDRASAAGIPYFRFTEAGLEQERLQSESL